MSIQTRIISLILFVFIISDACFAFDVGSFFNIGQLTQGGVTAFLSSIEVRKKQQTQLEKAYDEVKKQAEQERKALQKAVDTVDVELSDAKNILKKDEGKKSELISKQITLFNDKKNVLTRALEFWSEKENILEKHSKLIQEIIDVLSKDYELLQTDQDGRLYYRWNEYKQAQTEIGQLINKIINETRNKEALVKQKNAERESLTFLKKQFEGKTKEREKLVASENKTQKDNHFIQLEVDILGQELDLLKRKISYSNLKIELFSSQVSYEEDEIQLEQYRLNQLQKRLPEIEKKLELNIADVQSAKEDAKNIRQQALRKNEQLNKERELKKSEREQFGIQLTAVEEEFITLKETKAEESVDLYVAQAQVDRVKSKIFTLDKEIELLDVQKELETIKVERKEQEAHIIDVRYKLFIGHVDVEELLASFKNKKELSVSAIKVLDDKRNSSINFSIECSRELELFRTKKQTIEEKKTLFKGYIHQFKTVIVLLSEVIGQIHKRQQITAQYQRINSDLVHIHNEIIDQSEFIITELESRILTLSVWKRSVQAISFQGFRQSLFDAENFAKQFFWETPERVSPSAIIESIRQMAWLDFTKFALFLLFFFFLFLTFRRLLVYFKSNIIKSLTLSSHRRTSMYFSMLGSVVEYVSDNFILLFTWFYFFIAVTSLQSYLPHGLRFLGLSYFKALFYFLSIPLLVYLARQFLYCLKMLNQKLSFLFFTEKFQDKFIFLITAILYATSILIPLRLAFLHYSDVSSEFGNVLLAAYSLILVVVILFFFTKEDVLKLLPSNTPFLLWIKKKIGKFYHPVFTFFMGLLILSNPYIGYSNLAWYLAFAVPCSTLVIYSIFLLHYTIRRYSAFFFIREEEEEVIDKFEHARTYYGFFIVFAFLFLLLGAFLIMTRIWRFDYTVGSLWRALNYEWVLKDVPVPGAKLGIVELMSIILFIAGGFFVSSLFNRFVLVKLFDIFRTGTGTQNTVSRILHYMTIFLATVLGFASIKLTTFVGWVIAGLSIGISFSLRDLVADFVSGFWVLIERPLEIGHFIQTGELFGTVQKIAVRATTIRTARNFSIVIPNRELVSKPIINWNGGRYAVGFELELIVDYSADPRHVERIMRSVIQNHSLVLRVPSIVIRLDKFAENGMYFFARAFISSRKVREQWDIASAIRLNIIDEFKKNGIVIPYPQRVMHTAGEKGAIRGSYSYEFINSSDEKKKEESSSHSKN